MTRAIPVAWTAFQLALASAAAFLLYETDALSGAAASMLLVH
ncbi:MAG: hypothetical protein ACXWC4_10935 [Telluria sp.]